MVTTARCSGKGSQTFVNSATLYRKGRDEGEKDSVREEGRAGKDDREDRRGRGEAGGRQEGGRAPAQVLQRVHEEPGGQIQHREHIRVRA